MLSLTDLFPDLQPVPLAEVEQAFKPALVSVSAEGRGDLEHWMDRELPETFRLFSHLGNLTHCPRRYPILWEPPAGWRGRTAGAPLISDGQCRDAKPFCVPSSSLPKELRATILPLPGERLVLLDMRSCHPTVLGVLARDEKLLADARDGTFKKWLEGRLPAEHAKAMGHALVAGGGAAYIHEQTDGSVALAEADDIKRTFWARYPAAHACHRDWLRRIERTLGARKGFIVSFGGWCPAVNSKNDLWLRPYPTLTCWTSILRAAEAALLDRMMVVWRAAGAHCALPLYDGALIAVPDAVSPEELAALAEREATAAGIPMRVPVALETVTQ